MLSGCSGEVTEAPRQNESGTLERISTEGAKQLLALEQREAAIAASLWAKELQAQRVGRTFESFWDQLNRSSNRYEVAKQFPVRGLQLLKFEEPETYENGLLIFRTAGRGQSVSAEEWPKFLENIQGAGWELVQTEFRHQQFSTTPSGAPGLSSYYFLANLVNSRMPSRISVEGNLVVRWGEEEAPDGILPVWIDASELVLKRRDGEVPFKEVLMEQVDPLQNSNSIDPLMVHDLDGDGIPEVILAGRNLVYQLDANGGYVPSELCAPAPGPISNALIADFNGDGSPDFLCQKYEGFFLYLGSGTKQFSEPPRKVHAGNPEFRFPMVMTCGDIDLDGDLDLFVAQYKDPYEGGAVPTPFYDANDGYPSFLLINDGRGSFKEATREWGLEKKRWRRTYSASFGDLDRDGDLDLVVVSDFSGVDIYENNGKGKFIDRTTAWLSNWHLFGMAHAFSDFNRDGFLDLLVMGMTSPTADRLDHLRLYRLRPGEDATFRGRMAQGNRLYLGGAGVAYQEGPMSRSISRSGWSWGCTAADFNNDSYPDVYVGNGLESNSSVRDYEPEFWLHDIHIGTSEPDSTAYLYFKSKISRTRGRDWSYGGYEKNRLFWNDRGEQFIEVGHLLGVALEEDSRNVVSADLNGDGRLDLVVTTFEIWPQRRQTVRVYQNSLKQTGNWLAVKVGRGGDVKGLGATVTIKTTSFLSSQQLVNGDSFRSQHPAVAHFGLGPETMVEWVECRWPGGEVTRVDRPGVNQVHLIEVPKK